MDKSVADQQEVGNQEPDELVVKDCGAVKAPNRPPRKRPTPKAVKVGVK